MSKIKVMSFFGTRPEAIKMVPVVKALENCPEIESIVCLSGQHREMLRQVLKAFDVQADFDLDIMKPRQTITTITSGVLEGMEQLFKEQKPDLILVHGDTTTAFAGALAGFYAGVSVGHVEAGLRTFDKYSPYPEEMNRCLIGRVADLHFSPTDSNRKNLEREATVGKIYVTGNTVIDALKMTVQKDYVFREPALNELNLEQGRLVLVTAHRRENLGEPLRRICTAIRQMVEQNPDVQVVYPVHLNPAVREVANEILGGVDRIHLIEPIDVFDMHNLMDRCYMVMTDSGGLQEEAPALGKPVLVLRTETERPEAVEYGTVKMAGVETEVILSMANELLRDPAAYEKMAHAVNPYGDGNAAARITDAILHHFGKGKAPEEFKV
ncbi:MAG: UDP-N-acetylglucosamine 2-epimerase (non-hydrolyzing) [Clostridia bacterium]|nr:UDP-N-acetylglucosamine 2-epimerase (non-hydrolyzing) [Clostridia bacterium]